VRGWDDGLRTILWASQVEPERHPFSGSIGDSSLPYRIEHYLRDFVAENPGFRLVVRYHPSQQEVFIEHAAVHLSRSDEDLGALLHAVDVAVVTTSTVGLEAALAGLPVISVDCSVFTEDAPYSRMGIATGVPQVEALGDTLRGLWTSAGRDALRRLTFNEATPATENVVHVIESLF
jgi:CDP-glycerol glycerophosphotransferase (TagB/SpsB family)